MFFISLKNMFTSICSILTLYLIYQVLFTNVVEKPTTTSREQKDLDIGDLPEVVVCLDPSWSPNSTHQWDMSTYQYKRHSRAICYLDPGLNYTSLMKYGYHSTYSLGVIDKKFTGWNGGAQETKSSDEILEEALEISLSPISPKQDW